MHQCTPAASALCPEYPARNLHRVSRRQGVLYAAQVRVGWRPWADSISPFSELSVLDRASPPQAPVPASASEILLLLLLPLLRSHWFCASLHKRPWAGVATSSGRTRAKARQGGRRASVPSLRAGSKSVFWLFTRCRIARLIPAAVVSGKGGLRDQPVTFHSRVAHVATEV